MATFGYGDQVSADALLSAIQKDEETRDSVLKNLKSDFTTDLDSRVEMYTKVFTEKCKQKYGSNIVVTWAKIGENTSGYEVGFQVLESQGAEKVLEAFTLMFKTKE